MTSSPVFVKVRHGLLSCQSTTVRSVLGKYMKLCDKLQKLHTHTHIARERKKRANDRRGREGGREKYEVTRVWHTAAASTLALTALTQWGKYRWNNTDTNAERSHVSPGICQSCVHTHFLLCFTYGGGNAVDGPGWTGITDRTNGRQRTRQLRRRDLPSPVAVSGTLPCIENTD